MPRLLRIYRKREVRLDNLKIKNYRDKYGSESSYIRSYYVRGPSINLCTSKIPKMKSSMTNVLTKYVGEFGENIFSTDGSFS